MVRLPQNGYNCPMLRPLVVDVETTGFGRYDKVVEIAAVTLDPVTWEIIDEYDTLINPERDVGPTGVHGISASMVEAAPTFAEILAAVAGRLRGSVLVAHNLAFDARMLRYEFERLGVDIDLGSGLCTYLETRKKLPRACEEHDIHLTQQHRALADARATAELARRLGLSNRPRDPTAVKIGNVPHTTGHNTLRREFADEGTSPMHRIVSRADYPHCRTGVRQYLDMLDWVLDDGVIDSSEHSEIEWLARELGISEESRMDAHRAYLDCIILAAERDGVISAAEHELIRRIANELGVHDADVPEVSPVPDVARIGTGSRVCLTGMRNKAHLRRIARHAGFRPVPRVTKKGCDLLVAADVATSSAKARNARKWGIPIVSVESFMEVCDGD